MQKEKNIEVGKNVAGYSTSSVVQWHFLMIFLLCSKAKLL